jgi:hypothetical protein
MGKFQVETTEEEDQKLILYAIKNGLGGKVAAVKRLIGELPKMEVNKKK